MLSVRHEFPLLKEAGENYSYLDTAATSQKPERVISAVSEFYNHTNANIHRGVYDLSHKATEAYEASRETIKNFLNAKRSEEIVFVRGVTEGVNLLAQTFGRMQVKEGDEILISHMEHHSNIVPWQLLSEQVGAKLKVIPVSDSGELEISQLETLLTDRVKLLSLVHVSNALGTINPVKEIITKAHAKNIPVVIDGAQAVTHMPVDVQELDCDFYLFSGHKVYGPTGIGVLYGKEKYLADMPPYHGGGDMIETVTFEKSTYLEPPQRFEAGTVNIAGAVGLAEALKFLEEIGWEKIQAHESTLLEQAHTRLKTLKGIQFIGEAKNKSGVVSFNLDSIHPHDVGTFCNQHGVAVRTGHHCAQPLMDRFKISATVRASFGLYNTVSDINALVSALEKTQEFFYER